MPEPVDQTGTGIIPNHIAIIMDGNWQVGRESWRAAH